MKQSKLSRRPFAAGAAALSLAALAHVGIAQAQPADVRAGRAYQPVAEVSQAQAQLVILRKGGATPGGAHVYVDGSFNTSLLPGTFARICVPAGMHTVEAYVGDAPLYAGKTTPKTRVNLAGGTTYFVAVSDQGTGELVPYKRADMEPLLTATRELDFMDNRASSVVPCESVAGAVTTYTFKSDVLFRFGRSDYSAISAAGRSEISKVAMDIREKAGDGAMRIAVRGHADPIGSSTSNMALSLRRAQSVRRLLVDEGVSADWITTEGSGSTQPVIDCSKGPATRERIDCNAPNRRVEVSVQSANN